MKSALSVIGLLLVFAIGLPGEAQAQAPEVKVKEMTVTLMDTPNFNHSGQDKKIPRPKKWIEIEVEFEAKTKDKSGFIDELDFAYYIMMADKKTMYVERVTHVNIRSEEETFSSMFISPTTIEKLTGEEATSDSVVAGVAIEISYKGGVIGGDSTVDPRTKWWQGKQQTPGGLLKKSDTPFAILWWDRYAEVKQAR